MTRVALIGFGHGGAVFHAPLIRATAGLTLGAIVTSEPARKAAAERAHPGAVILPDAGSLWARADEFELVVIASPNRSHAPLARAALARGLPVVIDKPMAVTARDAETLIEEAARRGLLLTVFQNRRWDGDFLTARRLIEDGSIGDVFRFESRFDRWRPTLGGGWRESGDAEAGSGLLFDLGSHLIDQALVLFGPVTHVYAELDRRRAGAAADDDSFVALTHASGVRSHLWMSAVAAEPGVRLRVLGRQGAFVKHGLDPQEDALRAGADPSDPGFGEESADRWGTFTDGGQARVVPTLPGSYRAFYDGVLRALGTGGRPPVEPADAVRTLRVIEAARRAAAAGTTVALA
jgi:predicted dehydrogenase